MVGGVGTTQLAPEAAALLARDDHAIAGVEKLRFFPLAVTSGEGSYLIEAGGRRLLDLSASWTAAGLGYGHPEIADAVSSAARAPAGASGLSSISADAIALAERLIEIVPMSGDLRVYLGNAGTDANESVLQACRRATGRRRVVAFIGGYHGGLGLARAVSQVLNASAPADPGVTFLPYPDPVRPRTGDVVTTVEQDLVALDRNLAMGDVACVILEPIQSDGGIVIPAPGFLSGVRDITHRHGVPLIVDEVKVGLGRTGALHAFSHEGISPDIVTFGKSLGAGLPLSAAVGPAEILDSGTASSLLTSAANPICARAGITMLDILIRDDLATRAGQVGGAVRDALTHGVTQQGLHGCVGDVRGRGLTIGIDLVSDERSRQRAPGLARKAVYRAWQLGAIVFYVGGNVLEVTPPLTLSDQEAREGVSILLQAIAEAEQVSDDEVAAF
ncbi:MAG: aspartate aminotransferase family protein, partial [Candidatus Nanopelagicales bacterium]